MPSALGAVDLWQPGGATDHQTDTAYAQRGAPSLLGIEANWDEVGQSALERHVLWARQGIQACAPYSTGGAYLNFPGFKNDPATP